MKEEFLINDKTKVIAVRGNKKLLCNTDSDNIDDIREKGIMIDENGSIISPVLPIGVFLKSGYWEQPNDEQKRIFTRKKNVIMDGLLGFAVGDAFGVPVEFLDRKSIRKMNLNNMIGFGTHGVPAGSWSDDTSMLIATMNAIISDNGYINYNTIMDNYISWLYNAEYTSIDFTFGVGGIILESLKRYMKGIEPLKCGGKEFMDNGNGSLMRIFPISIYCILNNFSQDDTVKIINDASSITHANDISKMSCYIYTEFLRGIINNKKPIESFEDLLNIDYSKYYSSEAINAHKRILNRNYEYITDNDIKQSGYVVDTLEAVVYSILNSNNYEESIKTAVNLGYDTDTVAGITGSIAGIIYGYNSIPKRWVNTLKKKDYLEKLALKYDNIINVQKKNEGMNSRFR